MEGKRSRECKSHQKEDSDSSSSSSDNSSPGSPSSPGQPAGQASGANAFANDGSFLELFKRKMEEEQRKSELPQGQSNANLGQSSTEKTRVSGASFVGKRRGGAKLTLKTGMVVKKQKLEDKVEASKGDAWTKYMAEVKKYKAHQCGDDDKTRPLVK